MFIFASDAHGTGKVWIEKIKKTQKLYPNSHLVLGGDYIDGRKYSKETLNFVYEEYCKGSTVLRGNHEEMLCDFAVYNDSLWTINGYRTTIKSLFNRGYSKSISRLLLNKYKLEYKDNKIKLIDFIKEIKPMAIFDNIIFVHAGIKPYLTVHPENTNEQFALWAREEYFWKENSTIFTHNKTNKSIVSGHTPTIFIYGQYENNIKDEIPQESNDNCPVKVIQCPNEKPKIFTDNGCHGSLPSHTGNIVVLNDLGNLVNVIS